MTNPLKQKYLNACIKGDVDIINYMIKYTDQTFKNNKLLFDCLENACKYGHLDVFDIISEYVSATRSITPVKLGHIIFEACVGGNTDIINKVIEIAKGVSDLSYRNFLHRAVIGACWSGNVEIYKLVTEKIQCTEPVCVNDHLTQYACKSGNIDLVKFFLGLNTIYNG